MLANAGEAGVRRVVLLSAQAVSTRPGSVSHAPLAALEEAVRNSGRTHTLTGPAATTPRERAEAIAGALGAPLSYVEVTRDQAREQMLRMMPEPVAEGTLSILAEPTPEEVAVSPDVERVLGRAPLSFRDWAEQHADLFR